MQRISLLLLPLLKTTDISPTLVNLETLPSVTHAALQHIYLAMYISLSVSLHKLSPQLYSFIHSLIDSISPRLILQYLLPMMPRLCFIEHSLSDPSISILSQCKNDKVTRLTLDRGF